jgi:hypothetical protein
MACTHEEILLKLLKKLPWPPQRFTTRCGWRDPGKRSRQWEKRHQSHKAVYRGVDPKLALKVKEVASELVVPEGEVARAVIEFALREYQEGGLDLIPRPNPCRMKMTLFPTGTRSLEPPAKTKKQKPREQLWRVITTWRGFPPELKSELAVLASDDGLNVPVGELITALLRFGLRAYEYGLLNFQPVQKTNTPTLEIGGKK